MSRYAVQGDDRSVLGGQGEFDLDLDPVLEPSPKNGVALPHDRRRKAVSVGSGGSYGGGSPHERSSESPLKD